jgi:hypothetical protein
MRILVALTVAAMLCGCANSPEQIAAAQDEKCRSFGAQPGTQPYLNCRLQLEQQAHERRALAARMIAGAADGFNFTPAPNLPAPPMAPMPTWNNPSNTIHCNSRNTGWGSSETNCQ